MAGRYKYDQNGNIIGSYSAEEYNQMMADLMKKNEAASGNLRDRGYPSSTSPSYNPTTKNTANTGTGTGANTATGTVTTAGAGNTTTTGNQLQNLANAVLNGVKTGAANTAAQAQNVQVPASATTKSRSAGTGGTGGTAQNAAEAREQAIAAARGKQTAETPEATPTADAGYERPETAAYAPSQEVLDAMAALQGISDSKPQGYTSKYGAQMEELLQQIMNPGQFQWDFNGDELFKSYADLYTQNGKQASMDAMGQAAALTGGYGNSYAQQVGNQAYDEYLRALYDKGLEFRDRAYEQWLNEQQGLYNQYGLLNDTEAQDYNRYRDTVGDWENERGYLTDRYDTLSQQDYSRYADQRDFGENQYQYDTNMKENIRQFNESLDWDKMSTQQKYAAEYVTQMLSMGLMPSAELLQQAGLSQADAAKMVAQIAQTAGVGGGGGGGGNGGPSGNTTPPATTVNPFEEANQKWQSDIDKWTANYLAERDALVEEAEDKNKKNAVKNNKKTGNLTGQKNINYTVKVNK